jgi:hypothetical protein
MRQVKRSMSMGNPVTEATKDEILFCAYCYRGTTKIEALSRKFNTGFSGCCNDNLVHDMSFINSELRAPNPIEIIED